MPQRERPATGCFSRHAKIGKAREALLPDGYRAGPLMHGWRILKLPMEGRSVIGIELRNATGSNYLTGSGHTGR